MGAAPNYLEQSVKAIRAAEHQLQTLLSQAGTDGDYDTAARIIASAKALNRVAETLEAGVIEQTITTIEIQKTGAYPKFFRSRDNKLIVIGWSAKTNTEYEHKAPRNVLDRLIAILLEQSKGKSLSIEEIKSNPKMKNEKSEFPEYFLRAYLRWLKNIDLIAKHGHQGYSVKNPDSFKDGVTSHWKRLPIR